MRKTTQLRNLIYGNKLGILIEAHNGLTAKIAEETGFRAIWASGLAMSASLGVRDNNEASWTQILDILEFMSDCTNIPILLDGDTGYGDYNNVRRLVRKLEQRDISGVCIEDKLLPKANSFIQGEKQPLADIDEFCGKIKAGKDIQKDKDFVIVARVEAFIAGWGFAEVLKRATAYSKAGADALLIHSKISDASQIVIFMKNWKRKTPIIVVPTMYPHVPLSELQKIGISAVIWANQTIRSVVSSTKETLSQLFATKDLKAVEEKICPVNEIFRLQDVKELKVAEKKYKPKGIQKATAIVLGANKGDNFGNLTKDKPKCMIPIFGKPILSHIVGALNNAGIKEISVVVGYKKESVNLPNLDYIVNNNYDSSGILSSLYLARNKIGADCIISFADVVYESAVLSELLKAEGDIVLAVDVSWCQGYKKNRAIDAVICSEEPSYQYGSKKLVDLKKIRTGITRKKAHGEWIGLIKLNSRGSKTFKNEMLRFKEEDERAFTNSDITDLLDRIIKSNKAVKVLYISGQWLDIDSIEDVSDVYKTHNIKL